jgi:hypothetical protein
VGKLLVVRELRDFLVVLFMKSEEGVWNEGVIGTKVSL